VLGALADAFITLPKRLLAEQFLERLDQMPRRSPVERLVFNLYQLGRAGKRGKLLAEFKAIDKLPEELQDEIWRTAGEFTDVVLEFSELSFGARFYRPPDSPHEDGTADELPNAPVAVASTEIGKLSTSPPTLPDNSSPFSASQLDPSRCPGCDSDVPAELEILPLVPCPACQRWELHTGREIVPVSGPVGTPPQVVRLTAPHWLPRLVIDQGAPLARGNLAPKETKGSKKAKPGRPQIASPEEDERTFNDWKAADLTRKDFARARGLKLKEVEKACSRHRARRSRAKKKGRKPRTN
jgi:hypothetical protein